MELRRTMLTCLHLVMLGGAVVQTVSTIQNGSANPTAIHHLPTATPMDSPSTTPSNTSSNTPSTISPNAYPNTSLTTSPSTSSTTPSNKPSNISSLTPSTIPPSTPSTTSSNTQPNTFSNAYTNTLSTTTHITSFNTHLTTNTHTTRLTATTLPPTQLTTTTHSNDLTTASSTKHPSTTTFHNSSEISNLITPHSDSRLDTKAYNSITTSATPPKLTHNPHNHHSTSFTHEEPHNLHSATTPQDPHNSYDITPTSNDPHNTTAITSPDPHNTHSTTPTHPKPHNLHNATLTPHDPHNTHSTTPTHYKPHNLYNATPTHHDPHNTHNTTPTPHDPDNTHNTTPKPTPHDPPNTHHTSTPPDPENDGRNTTGRREEGSCISGEWLCLDGSACVPFNATCSGVAECQDESDEAVGLCGCLPNEYQCRDKCIDVLRRCDTVADCPLGEDEADCETWLCPKSHTKCSNSLCVPSYAVCNFIDDCGDASDEHNCEYRACYYGEYRCDNGECIRPGMLCDGRVDCNDGTDEKQCSPADFVTCGEGRRVHRVYWCDGWPDCADNHADELNCGGACAEDQFMCNNTRCIAAANVCDALCDCTDCDDEVDCDEYYVKNSGLVTCQPGVAFTCVQRESDRSLDRCINSDHICDAARHCYGLLTDETGCYNGSSGECPVFPGDVGEPVRCLEGRCLPSKFRCDFHKDCINGEDEEDCPVVPCEEGRWRCGSGQCVDQASRCDLMFDCRDKTDEMFCEAHMCPGGQVQCDSGQCVQENYWCDHYPDCPDKSDELHCERPTCGPDQFPCATGDQCIPLEQRCRVSSLRHLACADGSHLLDCRSMECPPGMFKCRSGVCLDPDMQCNAKADCPHTYDDEDFCPFECSEDCTCIDVEADCSNLNLTRIPDHIEKKINRFLFADNNLSVSLHEAPIQGYDNIVYLDLTRNHIQYLLNGTFRNLWRLRILILSENNITSLYKGAFSGLHSLRSLHLQGNQISVLGEVAFYGLGALPTLDLNDQRIDYIAPRAFVGLRNLTTLTLTNNRLKVLDEAVFTGLRSLQKLEFSHNQIELLNDGVFHTLPELRHLETDEWRWCCLAPPHVDQCLPTADQFSSCEDLMSNLVLRVCIWTLGFVALIGNTFVILWRTFHTSGNKMHSFLIINLGLGDLLMGVYLLIVAVVDLQYRGVYAAHELSWRTSSLCQMAGFISTFSSELSVFTLTVITVDRLIVIKFPFGVRRLETVRIRVVMALVWVVVGLLSALPLADLSYFDNFYGRSGVCLALHITNEKPNGWEYAVFIFLVLNLLSFSVIAISYALMYVVARDTHTAAYGSPEARLADSGMATRMTLIVATDALCWLPIIFLGIASLSGMTIPPKVFSWIAVFVLPLNAAVNPVLYTLSTTPVRKSLGHLVRSLTNRARRSSTSSLTSGTRWTSFKSRLTTDDSELPNLGDAYRLHHRKSSSVVYRPSLTLTHDPTHSNGPLDGPPNNLIPSHLVNGREDLRTSEREELMIPLCAQDVAKKDDVAMELQPLGKLTAVQGMRNYRIGSRKKDPNNLYD